MAAGRSLAHWQPSGAETQRSCASFGDGANAAHLIRALREARREIERLRGDLVTHRPAAPLPRRNCTAFGRTCDLASIKRSAPTSAIHETHPSDLVTLRRARVGRDLPATPEKSSRPRCARRHDEPGSQRQLGFAAALYGHGESCCPAQGWHAIQSREEAKSSMPQDFESVEATPMSPRAAASVQGTPRTPRTAYSTEAGLAPREATVGTPLGMGRGCAPRLGDVLAGLAVNPVAAAADGEWLDWLSSGTPAVGTLSEVKCRRGVLDGLCRRWERSCGGLLLWAVMRQWRRLGRHGRCAQRLRQALREPGGNSEAPPITLEPTALSEIAVASCPANAVGPPAAPAGRPSPAGSRISIPWAATHSQGLGTPTVSCWTASGHGIEAETAALSAPVSRIPAAPARRQKRLRSRPIAWPAQISGLRLPLSRSQLLQAKQMPLPRAAQGSSHRLLTPLRQSVD